MPDSNQMPTDSSQYDYSTRELLTQLDQLEPEIEGDISAADIQRDASSPSLDTYYRRFGWEIGKIREAHQRWKDTGTVPESATTVDWHSYHTNQNRYTTQELMENLARIDANIEGRLSRRAVRSAEDAPSDKTFIDHFAPECREWSTVINVYEEWRENADIRPEVAQVD